MSAFISPVGLATTALVANQVSLLVTFKERLNGRYGKNNVPTTSIAYSYETPILNGGTLFIPIVATITTNETNCCGNSTARVYKERFYAAIQGQTELPTTITVTGVGTISGVRYGNHLIVEDSLTISIT